MTEVVFYHLIRKPLEFSSFPTILLITTMLRLALNLVPREPLGARPGVAATRVQAPQGAAAAATWLHDALPATAAPSTAEPVPINGFVGAAHRLNPALTFDTLVAGPVVVTKRASASAKLAKEHVA